VTFLVASAEGAVVLSRAQQDIEPFEVVADQLIEQAAAMPKVVTTTAHHPGAGDEYPSEANAHSAF
jgi:hypothetical protein